jgi:uncharacterized protein YegP (UPF0339 family)
MIKIHKSKDGQFYYTVHAKNGKILVQSETMKTIKSIYKGITSLTKVFSKSFKVKEVFKKGKI